jgi:hypothetical protein
MRKYLLAACTGLLVGVGLASGQSQNRAPYLLPPIETESVAPQVFAHVLPRTNRTLENAEPISNPAICETRGPRVWGGGEYLIWWLKNSASCIPLVTTGDPVNDATAGSLGSASTRVLFNGSDLRPGPLSGMRFTVGAWLDADATWGLEASGFVFLQGRKGFAAGSDANGNPPLYVPVFLSDFGSEGKFLISDPTVPFLGKIALSATTQLWGAEANVLRNLMNQPASSVDFLIGFRYLSLNEHISLQADAANDPVNDVSSILSERFGTRNNFFGGQFGTRVEYRAGPLALELLGKVALGSTFQVSEVSGSTTLGGAGVTQAFGVASGTYPGAIFAQSSNIGRQTGSKFTIAPQVQVKLCWDVTSWLRAFASYDFLYWDNVVRPADQIDRNVNSAQSPLSPNFGNAVSPVTPAPMFNRAEFWAQGVSLGLEFRY